MFIHGIFLKIFKCKKKSDNKLLIMMRMSSFTNKNLKMPMIETMIKEN